jgi:hypothetical protein
VRKKVAYLMTKSALPEDLRRASLLIRASLKDEAAMKEITTLLPTLSFDDQRLWIYVASGYSTGVLVTDALDTLASKALTIAERASLMGTLCFAFKYEVKLLSLSGSAAGGGRIRHSAAPRAAQLACTWAKAASSGSPERLRLLVSAVELGEVGAAHELRNEVRVWSTTPVPSDEDDSHHFHDDVRSAIDALASTSAALTPPELFSWSTRTTKGSFNLINVCIRLIAKEGSEKGLELLVQLDAVLSYESYLRGLINDELELLAPRYGIRLGRDAAGAITRMIPAEATK